MNPLEASELKMRINSYLLACGDNWTSGSQLAHNFCVRERDLRGDNGLCHGIAISSNDGYKSLAKSSDTEFAMWKNRIRSHAIAELAHISAMEAKRTSERQQLLSI